MSTVILGPWRWATVVNAMPPGTQHTWAFSVLVPVTSPGSPPGTTIEQNLQALNVTVVPARDPDVQALEITELIVVISPNGEIDVNMVVKNQHPTSSCAAYKWWASLTVNEPALEVG